MPYVARKTVDLAPALVLSAQLLFGALFGIMGLALADPMVAMLKTALEQKSKEDEAERRGLAEMQLRELIQGKRHLSRGCCTAALHLFPASRDSDDLVAIPLRVREIFS